MNSYNGIPISEYRLPIIYVLFFVMFLAMLVAALYLLRLLLGERNEKKAKRFRKMKKKAGTNKDLAKLLVKEERKRRWKKNRSDNIFYIFLFTVVIAFECCVFVFGVLNPLLDHINKDYVVYTGEVKVDNSLRHPYIELADGTVIRGGTDLAEEDTYGTVVYAKRSKIALGGIISEI